MTVPPGGPYGQNPYGTNPYGQQPHWGGQPQSGPHPYPPGGPYPNPSPYQQVPPGWPPGPYPAGPPPKGPRSKLPWLILAGVAVLGVVALVVFLVLNRGTENTPTTATSPTPAPMTSAPAPQAPTGGPPTQAQSSLQTATDCTPNVSGGAKPTGNAISAGKLSFPTSAAPGWSPVSDDQNPNLINAVGVAQPVPGTSDWVMEAEVAITNFVPSMDVTAQATKLMQCTANGPGYANASPTLGPTKTSSIMVDGVKAARVDADITIADATHTAKGDSVSIVAVDTKPVTIFLGATPIGDSGNAATINRVIAALKVSKH